MNTRANKILMSMTAAMSAFIFTACPGNKGGNNNPPPPPPPCVAPCGQATGGTLLAQALGKSSDDSIHLGVVFSTTGTTTPPAPGQVTSYNGQATAVGTLIVKTPYPYVECPIPAGSYQIVTITPANWSMQSFGGLVVEARGPTVLRIRLPNNYILSSTPPTPGADGILYPYHLQLSMFVDSINGISCSPYGIQFGEIVLQ